MSGQSSSSSGGIGFTGLLTVVFITLKLCNIINWSWWWVLSPIWITAGIVIIVLLVVVAVEKNTSRKLKRKYRKQETGNGG